MYRRIRHSWVKHLDFMMLDLLCMHVAFLLAYMVRQGLANPYRDKVYMGLLGCMTLANVFVGIIGDTYRNILKRGIYFEFYKTAQQVIYVMLLAMCYLYIIKEGESISRLVLGYMGVLYYGLSFLSRNLWKLYLKTVIRNRAGKRSLLLVTTSERVESLLERIQRNNFDTFAVQGLVLLDAGHPKGTSVGGIPVVAEPEDAAEYVCREWVDEVLVSIPGIMDYPEDLIAQFMEMGLVVHLNLPDTFNPYGQNQFLEKLGGMNVLTSSIRMADGVQLFWKRCLDIVIGLVGAFIAVIFTVIFGPIIYINSPGPIFFKQTRVGKNGKKFQMYKFRSMYLDAEERKAELMRLNDVKDGMMFKIENDPRIIGSKILPDGTVKKGIGNFIRDYSIDEFPQFFNVLKGEMSVVGTRPPTVDEWEKYELHHRQRLAIKPGITGLWQVSGRSNITDFEEVVALDTQYIAGWNIGQDVKIFLKTIGIVVRREGAR